MTHKGGKIIRTRKLRIKYAGAQKVYSQREASRALGSRYVFSLAIKAVTNSAQATGNVMMYLPLHRCSSSTWARTAARHGPYIEEASVAVYTLMQYHLIIPGAAPLVLGLF